MTKIRSTRTPIRPALPSVVRPSSGGVPAAQVSLQAPAPNIGVGPRKIGSIVFRRAPAISGLSAPAEATPQQMDLLRRAASQPGSNAPASTLPELEPAPIDATAEQQIDHMLRSVARLVSLHDSVRFSRIGGVKV